MSEVEVSAAGAAVDESAFSASVASSQMAERVHMVRKLSDVVVLPPSRLSGNERALISDILMQVLDKVEVELRVEVATRIARVAECPPSLMRTLLLDDVAVSGEILTHAEQLPEALLIEAAHKGSTAHRLMIAQRRDLTTSIADAALSHNEIDVCKALLRRGDCTLSPNAINTLVALSATIPGLRGVLLRRPELEPAHGFMMFWWVEDERRRRIFARFSLERRVIQDALADLYPRIFMGDNPDPFVKDVLTLADRRHKPRRADGEVYSGEEVRLAMHAARLDPNEENVEAVTGIANISSELAARMLRDAGGEPFAVLCKAMGLPRDDFFAIASDGDAIAEAFSHDAEYLLGLFDMMSRDFARAIIRYWNWDSNPRIAYIKRLLGITNSSVA